MKSRKTDWAQDTTKTNRLGTRHNQDKQTGHKTQPRQTDWAQDTTKTNRLGTRHNQDKQNIL
jgi:hypothetical protein